MVNQQKRLGLNPGRTHKDPPIFFIMMRLNVKVALICLMIAGISTVVVLYSICGKNDAKWERLKYASRGFEQAVAEEIDCDINGEYVVACRKEGDEVYVPFSFLHRYFEIYGKLATYDGTERFEWSHSYSRVHRPKSKYDPRGVFMNFENYNVEVRDRVKCVSAIGGVPVSTQWESQGYYYPTQIAQFGLSHYSKNFTDSEPRRKVLEDGDKEMAKWTGGKFERVYTDDLGSFVRFDSYDGVHLKVDQVVYFVMSLDLLLNNNSSFVVVLQNRESKEFYNLHYVFSDIWIIVQDNNIYHGVGTATLWQKLTRDLIVDLQKGLNYQDKDKTKHRITRSKIKIIAMELRGSGALDNLTLSSSEHILQFYNAAEWFVGNQDRETGGWAIPVKRKLGSGFQDLPPGWYSSMGQGQAISLLSRAYHHSGGDIRYLTAALNGLKPFKVSSSDGGVKATFLNKFNWYEEYPTNPASFVLNGFIYSLLGLYDLINIAPPDQIVEAESLYIDGMESLKNMLPLFDMGSVTSYDLRHFTNRIAPNLARWDYHATHVNQLLLLSTIDNDTIFKVTAERWVGYMNGKRADHN